ncbi:MerR family transcriptional regulator [Enemella evansiae]|nr:MerR family transcriptional regulator [Enemella evansiae]
MASTLGIDMGDKVKADVSNATATMTIGRLAEATGASARSLRHYEANGLITAERDSSDYRRYRTGTIERVQRIRRLLGAGFNLAEIAILLPCMDEDPERIDICPQVAGVVHEKLDALLSQSRELAQQRDQIRALIA